MDTIVRTGVSLLYQAVPEETQAKLIQIGENFSRDKWLIGDIANVIKDLSRQKLLNVSIMDIYVFIAQLLRDEISARTVEYYAGLSAFYEPGVREEYQPLSHSHFAFARSYGDDWVKILNLALDLMDKSGRVPSVSKVHYEYSNLLQSKTFEEPPAPPDDWMPVSCDTQTVESDYIDAQVSIPGQAAKMALAAMRRIFNNLGKHEQASTVDKILELLDNLLNSC